MFDAGRAARAAAKRAGKNRRKGEGHPTTAAMDYSAEELAFMQAMRDFQQRTGRKFPTLAETLRVVKSLGYARPPASAA